MSQTGWQTRQWLTHLRAKPIGHQHQRWRRACMPQKADDKEGRRRHVADGAPLVWPKRLPYDRARCPLPATGPASRDELATRPSSCPRAGRHQPRPREWLLKAGKRRRKHGKGGSRPFAESRPLIELAPCDMSGADSLFQHLRALFRPLAPPYATKLALWGFGFARP